MSYTPTEWNTGDVVTSAKLNKLEQGVANACGGVFVVNMTVDANTATGTLDKTWQEIYAAAQNGLVFLAGPLPSDLEALAFNGWLSGLSDSDGYTATFDRISVRSTSVNGARLTLSTNTADGYPSGTLS